MQPLEYRERRIEVAGWPVNLITYKLGSDYVCQADNVSPGACLARFKAPTLEMAESQSLSKAEHLLRKTRRQSVCCE